MRPHYPLRRVVAEWPSTDGLVIIERLECGHVQPQKAGPYTPAGPAWRRRCKQCAGLPNDGASQPLPDTGKGARLVTASCAECGATFSHAAMARRRRFCFGECSRRARLRSVKDDSE